LFLNGFFPQPNYLHAKFRFVAAQPRGAMQWQKKLGVSIMQRSWLLKIAQRFSAGISFGSDMKSRRDGRIAR
jgi:hypothetical protein